MITGWWDIWHYLYWLWTLAPERRHFIRMKLTCRKNDDVAACTKHWFEEIFDPGINIPELIHSARRFAKARVQALALDRVPLIYWVPLKLHIDPRFCSRSFLFTCFLSPIFISFSLGKIKTIVAMRLHGIFHQFWTGSRELFSNNSQEK